MSLRLAAALSLLLGLALLLAFLHLVGEGPFASAAARHMRAMKDRTAMPAVVRVASLASMRALPHQRPPAETAPLERGAVSLEGWIQRVMWASDGDVHLEVATTRPGDEGLGPYVTAEITTAFRRRHPGWRYEALAATVRPNWGSGRPWPGGPRRVRVSGWLLYDFQYDPPVSDELMATRAPRATGWEIHPVTRLEVWDEARGAWSEVGP